MPPPELKYITELWCNSKNQKLGCIAWHAEKNGGSLKNYQWEDPKICKGIHYLACTYTARRVAKLLSMTMVDGKIRVSDYRTPKPLSIHKLELNDLKDLNNLKDLFFQPPGKVFYVRVTHNYKNLGHSFALTSYKNTDPTMYCGLYMSNAAGPNNSVYSYTLPDFLRKDSDFIPKNNKDIPMQTFFDAFVKLFNTKDKSFKEAWKELFHCPPEGNASALNQKVEVEVYDQTLTQLMNIDELKHALKIQWNKCPHEEDQHNEQSDRTITF